MLWVVLKRYPGKMGPSRGVREERLREQIQGVFLIQSLMSQQWSPRLKKVVGK
jgi:hypothetical protein